MSDPASGTIHECPAFVDTHSHDDLILFEDPDRADKRNQGIGVQVIGNCGICPFPPLPADAVPVRRIFDSVMGVQDAAFDDVGDYRRRLGRDDIVVLQGYNALRTALFGPEPRRLDTVERARMAKAVSHAMEQGAAGLSLGLAYLPAIGCDMEELVDVAGRTPLLTVHLRNESSAVIESMDEAAGIARRAKCRLHISHLKISGRPFWNRAELLLKKISALHEELGATFDHYPYAFGCTGLAAILPPEISSLGTADLARLKPSDFERRFEDSDWENYVKMCGWGGIKAVSLEKYPEYNGHALSELGAEPLKTILRLVQEEPHPAMLIYSQDDMLIDELLRLPFGCVGTDGLPTVREHPRLTSTFPEFLKRCRSIGIPAEDAIHKASVLPRKIFGVAGSAGGVTRFDWSDGRVAAQPSPGSPSSGGRQRKTR